MIPWYFKLLGVGALIAALVGWGWVGGKSSERKAWQLKEAAQVAAQLAATEHARAVEQALQERVNDANTALQVERQKHARVASALRADADKLRSDIAKFASGGTGDTVDACNQRATTLGAVLDGVLSDYRACTNSAETVAADLRAIVAAWPR